jgi:hypothetical protein
VAPQSRQLVILAGEGGGHEKQVILTKYAEVSVRAHGAQHNAQMQGALGRSGRCAVQKIQLSAEMLESKFLVRAHASIPPELIADHAFK